MTTTPTNPTPAAPAVPMNDDLNLRYRIAYAIDAIEQGHPDWAQTVLKAAPAAQAASPVIREFYNELGNRIKITIEGPTSISENILTPLEVAHLRDALNAQAASTDLLARCKTALEWCWHVSGKVQGSKEVESLILALTAPPAQEAGLRRSTPEEDAKLDASLGLECLPPIRLPVEIVGIIKRFAALEGVIVQALVRDALTERFSASAQEAPPTSSASDLTDWQGDAFVMVAPGWELSQWSSTAISVRRKGSVFSSISRSAGSSVGERWAFDVLAAILKARRTAQEAGQAVPEDVGLPPAYMLAKLQMVMPLFQEARDALTALTEVQRKLHHISPTLADRMDEAGTYSLDQWLAAAP